MPIYEFYCRDCHRIYNFFSRTVNTEKSPACPRCGRSDLERLVSSFAVSRNRPEPAAGDGPMPDLDEDKLERAMAELERESAGLDENDPRQMATMMRRMFEATGLNMGGGMEEALKRMESGEDPDQIEADMGDLLEGEDPFSARDAKSLRRRFLPPAHDGTLYEL